MQCRFCLFHNPADEERCHRCGKRLLGDITVDGISLAGANALAPRRRRHVADTGSVDGVQTPLRRNMQAAVALAERQTVLFNNELSNVIPFESFQRPIATLPSNADVRNLAPGPAARRLTGAKDAIRKQVSQRGVSDTQGSLELEILPPAPQAPRTLKTTVEASIYCDAQVALPMHRSVAAMLDAAMVLIGCGLFVGVSQLLGVNAHLDRFNVVMFGVAVVLIAMFYGLLFAISGRETAGQRWADLRLINFDGFPADGTSRALRFAGCWLSFGAVGIGLLWALLDEENLTWHDHMSKTFLTMREVDSSFFRQR
jgi:uncharacterized RDD family membrane protein YckC